MKKKGLGFYNFYVYIRPIIGLIMTFGEIFRQYDSNFMESFPSYKICYIGFTILLGILFLILMSKSYDKDPGTYYFAKKVVFFELFLNTILNLMLSIITVKYYVSELSIYEIALREYVQIVWFIILSMYINSRKDILMYGLKDKKTNLKNNKLQKEKSDETVSDMNKNYKSLTENSILDKYDELIKLDELRKKNIITEEEFTNEKKKILK